MILQENYRKVAEYTQKAFKLYSRRYFANVILQILQKKQNIKQLQKIPSQINRNSNFSQKQSQLDLQNIENDKQAERDNIFQRTMKNIDMFDTLDRQNLFTDISYIKYGDVIFLEIYNAGMNPSDKSQRLRVHSQLQSFKYKRLSHFNNDSLAQKRCAFQIVNPYDLNNSNFLTGNSLFCLKSLFCKKYICLTNKVKISQFFGYELGMSSRINHQCFLSFKGIQSKQKKIISYEPIGIKICQFYFRAQGLQISCNMQGSVFYFNKISGDMSNLQPEFVKIKNVSLQKYLGSDEIQISKLMSKKTYSNVTIQDENGIPIKQNQLVFATLDFNKISESEVTFRSQNEQSMKNIWLLNPIDKNGILSKQEVKITHVCSGRSLVVKTDKTIKLSNNQSEISYFNLIKHAQNRSVNNGNESDFSNRNMKISKNQQSLLNSVGLANKQAVLNQKRSTLTQQQLSSPTYEILYQQSNVIIIKSRQQMDKNYLGIYEVHSLGHYKVQENKKILFEIYNIKSKQSHFILQLMQIQIVLKDSYEFIQKIGFIFQQRNEALRFCVQQIKKYNYLILYHTRIITLMIEKINSLVNSNNKLQIEPKKIQNYIKQLKIFQILICISKILNLKMGKKKHFLQTQQIKDPQRITKSINFNYYQSNKQKVSQTPFQLCQKYFQHLQFYIFQVIYNLTINNEQCSNTIVRQASFFNKLLMFYPQKIGKILQQAIKNLSLFTSKSSNSSNDCGQLFQWVKLIQNIREDNIMVQKTYIDIIAQVVIDPLDKGILPYQNKCRELLFNQRNKKKIMPRFGLQGDKPTITFQSLALQQFFVNNPNLKQIQHYSNNEACFSIQDFFTIRFQQEYKNMIIQKYIQYMISLIKLARNLCKDRNKKLLKVAQDYGLYQAHIVHILNSSKVEWKLKMQYLLLYSSILIDQDPFLSFDRRETKCHIWSKIGQYNLQNKTAIIFKQYTDYSSAIQKLKEFDTNIIGFLQSYIVNSSKLIVVLTHSISLIGEQYNRDYDTFIDDVWDQFRLFQLMIKFTYETMNFGYFNIFYIKKYISFIIHHYLSFSNLLQFLVIQYHEEVDKVLQIKNLFIKKQNEILNQIFKILQLNESIWIDINCMNLLKLFEKNYRQKKRAMTNFEFRQHCWKLLNNSIPILLVDDSGLTIGKNTNINNHVIKKKTTTKNMFQQQNNFSNINYQQQKTNSQFDILISKFFIRILITHNELSQMTSYSKLIQLISTKQNRNIILYQKLYSFLIINGKKQQTIYKDYSGRFTGKILNVIKIYQLIHKIKNSQYQATQDAEDQKRKKQKVIELNNLINKIKRQILIVKQQDTQLFKKFQSIIEKLNIDLLLMELLPFAHKPIYLQCISNLYKFYLQFIYQNDQNKKKLSNYFKLFMNNFKIQKCSILISQLYLSLTQIQKKKYIQQLFEKLHASNSLTNSQNSCQDNFIKQSVLQTLYRIIKKTKQKQLLSQIKSQFTFQIFKENDYTSLLTIGTNLSTQYINLLCQLASKCNFVYDKIRQIYPKTMLKKIIYQEHKYQQRSVLLKLFYYFYIKNNSALETHQIEDLIANLVLPQIKHLPSVCQYSALQNLQLNRQNNNGHKQQKNQKSQKTQKTQNNQNNQKNQNNWRSQKTQKQLQKSVQKAQNDKSYNKPSYQQDEQEITILKKKFQDLILYEQTVIQPSEQQKYWNFVYNTQDQEQMSLINFTILLLKIQLIQNPQKGFIFKRLSKSNKYIQFIKYLSQLCDFMKGAFKKNKDQYQRKIINKLQQILIIHEQRSQYRQKTTYYVVTQQDKKLLVQFFDEISRIIISENISYAQIIQCANVTNSQLLKKRGGQNIKLMILQQQFISFIQRLSKYISNIKQFNKIITQKKLTYFFSIYRCNKTKKINIYQFLQKLFQYLESIKNKNISKLNELLPQNNQLLSANFNHYQLKTKNNIFSFIDTANQNFNIQNHFNKYISCYNVVLRLTILSKWLNLNQTNLKLVFDDLQRQSLDIPISQQRIMSLIQNSPYRMVQREQLSAGQNVSLQWQIKSKVLVYLYLFKLCSGCYANTQHIINQNNNNNQFNPNTKNIIDIDMRYYKSSYSFSRVILFVLKKINSYQCFRIQSNQKILKKYVKQKIQSCNYQPSQTFNLILIQLVINFNKYIKNKHSPHIQHSNNHSKITYNNEYSLSNNNHHVNRIRMNFFEIRTQQNKHLSKVICQQILKKLDIEVNQILIFNFQYSLISFLQGNTFLQHFVPHTFKSKVQILDYGLLNGLIDKGHHELIQNCFIKIILIWANKRYDFSNYNWYQIFNSIINLIDKYMQNIHIIANRLSQNRQYVIRIHQLLRQCCQMSIKSTNVNSLTCFQLLSVISKFHTKFYLQNHRQALGIILNESDFNLINKSAEQAYNESIQSKLIYFQNQQCCQQNHSNRSNISNKCSYQLCNQNKITYNDENIMQIFVTFLITIQLSISMKKNHYFTKSLKPINQQTINNFQAQIKSSYHKHNLHTKLNYITFFKRFIGIVYLRSQQNSLVTLHFKIPYLQKYCTSTIKQQLLYYIKKLKKSNIQQHLDVFSKFFQAELQQKKKQYKIPLISTILQYKPIIQKFIIIVVLTHLILLLFPSINLNQTIFYPFKLIFIWFKIIFTVTSYKKSQNIINYIYEDKKLSFNQKVEIFTNAKFFINLALIILYLISFYMPYLIGLITSLEMLNLRFANKLGHLITKAFVQSIADIFIFFGIIAIFFGIMEWQSQKTSNFLDQILQSFKQFYTFVVSNFKISAEYQYPVSKKYPISFLLYVTLVAVFVYKNLLFFITELKTENDQINNMQKRCFICDKKTTDFQNEGHSFDDHTNLEHNLWHYLYFFIYLRRKTNKQFKAFKNIEISIKQSIAKKRYGFLNISTLQ